MPKKKKEITKRAGIKIEQKDEMREYWIKVAPITFSELAVPWTDRKVKLIEKLVEYKLDPTRQIYIRMDTDRWYIMLWQPVNPEYQPKEFKVMNNGIEYKFTKMSANKELLAKLKGEKK